MVPEGPGLAGCCCCLCSPLQSRKAGRRPNLALAAPRVPAAPGAHSQGPEHCPVHMASLWPQDLFVQVPPLFPSSRCQSLAKSFCSLLKGFEGHHTDHPLSLVLQMNRPIQVKPADSEGRGGRSPILWMPGTGRGAQGHPGGGGAHGGITRAAVGRLVCREIQERSCLCWWHPNLGAEQMPSVSLSGQLGGTS